MLGDWLFNPAGLTPHGFCLLWAPGLIWLHAGSDAIIALSYFSIPLALATFVGRRKDLEFRWVFYLFVGFILACGLTHVMAILTLWVPAYGAEGLVKVVTAILSVGTAALLWPLVPKLLALPSPSQLSRLNGELSERIVAQERTTALLRESEERRRVANMELEKRVAERTADLSLAKADLERMVEERTAALRQRDLLLREVYHRVKNNLQVIDAMVTMQARQIADPTARQALASLQSRIYALGLVHQQLMTSPDLETFDVAPFLHELSSNIIESGSHGDVELSVNACPLSVNLDFAIPLGLIVTELVTNSLKHAFPAGRGKVEVILDRSPEGGVVLTVADDGGGDPAEAAVAGAPGLGSRIMHGLVAQLNGVMNVLRHDGMKTEIVIPAPAAA